MESDWEACVVGGGVVNVVEVEVGDVALALPTAGAVVSVRTRRASVLEPEADR